MCEVKSGQRWTDGNEEMIIVSVRKATQRQLRDMAKAFALSHTAGYDSDDRVVTYAEAADIDSNRRRYVVNTLTLGGFVQMYRLVK